MSKLSAKSVNIETTRLLLRPLDPGDAPVITELADNWNVVQYMAMLPYPYEQHHAEDYIDSVQSADPATTFAVTERAQDGAFIGIMSFEMVNENAAGRLGYWFGEPYWGKGLATEAACAIIAFGFDYFGFNAFRAACHQSNAASRNVLEKCDFKPAGTGTMFSKSLNADHSVDRFILMHSDWQTPAASRSPVTITINDSCTNPQSG